MATDVSQTTQFKQTTTTEKKKDEVPPIDVSEVIPPNASEVRVEAKVEAVWPISSRAGHADAIIHRNVLWSIGAGVLPVPFLDMLAVTVVQMKLLAELSHLYGVTFREELAKKLIGSLVSGVVGVSSGVLLGGTLAKFIPVVGAALGVVSVPIIAGAVTHATGKVFLMHFEAGGTLLDFDPHAMRAHFREEFERAKTRVGQEHVRAGKIS
ncbi:MULTISPECIES: YcjF family protein [Sorangium]|uniref:YcjF family protein n=1 Tax=Sorangium TaxID=39643 RepID=UPI003D9C0ECC